MRTRIGSLLAGLLMASTALAAQQSTGWKAGAAIPLALPSLKDWTHRSAQGLCLDGAYQFSIPDTSSFFRAGLAANLFPGKEEDGRKTSLQNFQITGDLVIPLGHTPLALITGASLNAYRQDTTGTWSHTFPDAGTIQYTGRGQSTVKRAFSKFGFRFGLEYTLSSRISLSALLQQTELGTDSELVQDGQPQYGSTAVNPSWVQMGVKYHF